MISNVGGPDFLRGDQIFLKILVLGGPILLKYLVLGDHFGGGGGPIFVWQYTVQQLSHE